MSLTDIWEFLRAEWREEWTPAFRAAYVRGRKAGRRVAAADINLGDVLLARSDGHRRTTAPRRSRYAATYRGRSE
jgi:hypothetical protein